MVITVPVLDSPGKSFLLFSDGVASMCMVNAQKKQNS